MPNTVLISAGIDNQYGHPDSKAVAMYSRVADHVFQTNVRDGVSWLTKRMGSNLLDSTRSVVSRVYSMHWTN